MVSARLASDEGPFWLAESFLFSVFSRAERDSKLSGVSYKDTDLTLMTSFKPIPSQRPYA